MITRRKLHLLLTSARVANLPSVVCNVWLGVGLAAMLRAAPPEIEGWSPLLLVLSGLLLYLGGNLLNDWHDRHWDAQHRPERALPQGAFPPGFYLALAAILLGSGSLTAFAVSLSSGLVAGLVLICILGYTRWHKRSGLTILLIALCRALLPLLALGGTLGAGWASHDDFIVFWCLVSPTALMLYVAGLSLLARNESAANSENTPVLPMVWLAMAGLLMLGTGFSRSTMPGPLLGTGFGHPVLGLVLVGLLSFAVWTTLCLTRFRHPVRRQISGLLAGLPLLDGIALLPVSLILSANRQPDFGPIPIISLILPPLAFFAALILQRRTAAT